MTQTVTQTSAARTTRARTAHRCAECGWETTKWVGRCGGCQAWGAVEERSSAGRAGRGAPGAPGVLTQAACPITEIDLASSTAVESGVDELDRVLGGGVVPGAALLLAGEPGVGKSTLLLAVAAHWSAAGRRTLYLTAEESAAQVRLRAERTGAVHPELYLAAETDLSAVLDQVEQCSPSLLVVDSVQAIGTPAADGVPGGVTQVREVAASLVQLAKRLGVPVLMVGHVTKDGAIAGPRVLEHLVDVVLAFEGDRSSRLRFLRAVKNRFGPVDEVGCFDLSGDGISAVRDPTGLFVSRHGEPVSGTCVTVTMEGRRPLLAEVQALVAPSAGPSPRRNTSGLDPGRSAMVLAVLQRRVGRRLATADVYLATVGGARVVEPAADLATAIATASACADKVVPTDLVALGEVGLAGEVRRVGALYQRLAEAARLGFRHALVPVDRGDVDVPVVEGLRVIEVGDVRDALQVVGLEEGGTAQGTAQGTVQVAPNHGLPRVPQLSVVPAGPATP